MAWRGRVCWLRFCLKVPNHSLEMSYYVRWTLGVFFGCKCIYGRDSIQTEYFLPISTLTVLQPLFNLTALSFGIVASISGVLYKF
jgi:hypothetical protein